MGLLDALKDMLGISPVNIGELNRQATRTPPRPPSKPKAPFAPVKPPTPPDPLEGIEITDEYRKVYELLELGFPIVFVSGKAGTGKSTLIHYLRHTYKKNVVVVAPTGVAALNVEGSTIHSFFQFPHRIITDDDIEAVADRSLYGKLDLLIIDEISMVRADLVDAIDKFLRTNGKHRNLPFGGTQLMLVGDLFQLPPVVTPTEKPVLEARGYASPFFFSAKSLAECQMAPIELSKIFRQRDASFTDMLNKIRVSEQVETVITTINEACTCMDGEDDHIITLTCTNAVADRENRKELATLESELKIFKGYTSGRFAVSGEKLPSPLNLELKLGAQVMFTKNDERKRWVNGTLGRVIDFTSKGIQVELITDHPCRVHEVQQVTWESFRYKYDSIEERIIPESTGQYVQFPLMLAWAVTIHKSQGKTLEKVRVDLGSGAFASGQVYVALSRCRSLEDISLVRPIKETEVKCDQRIKRFFLALASPKEDILSENVGNSGGAANTVTEAVPRCPECGGKLKPKKRCSDGQRFWVCSNYPECRYRKNR